MPLFLSILAVSVSLLMLSGVLYFYILEKGSNLKWVKWLAGPVTNTFPPLVMVFFLTQFNVLYLTPQVIWLVVLPVSIIGGLRNAFLSFTLTIFTLLYFNFSFSIVSATAWLFVSGFIARRIVWRLTSWKFFVSILGTFILIILAYELIASKGNLSIALGWYVIYSLIGVVVILLFRGAESILKSSTKHEQREQFYHQFFEQIKGYYIKVDRNAIITDVNKSFASIFQLNPQDLVGKSICTVLKSRCFSDSRYLSIDPISFDAEVIGPNGEVLYTLWEGKWLDSDELVLTGVDLTRLRKAEIAEKAALRKYKMLHEGLLDAYVRVDKHGRIVEWNKAYLELTGYSEEEVVKLTYRDITPPKWHQMENRVVETVLKRGYSDLYEKEYRRKDGSIVPIELRTYLVTNEAGHPDGFWAIIRDISYRKQAESRILEAERQSAQSELLFESLLNAIPDVIGVQKTDQTVVFYNEAGYRMLGLGPEDIKGKKCYQLIGYTNPCEVCATRLVLQTKKPERVEKFVPEMNIWIEASSYPVLSGNGEIEFIIEHIRDITDRKNAEQRILETDRKLKEQNEEYMALNEELNEANQRMREINEKLMQATEKAQESDRLKSAFLANMSHEIRTPMNGIIGFCQLLQQPNISKEQITTFSNIIVNSSQHLLSIINDIIDISKIEAGQVSINHLPVSAKEQVQNVISLFNASARQKGLEIENASKNENDCIFLSDDVKIAQVLNNLVNNAIKFTQKGRIEVGFVDEGKYIRFWVSDTGIGIAPENRSLIYDRFRQVEGANPNSLKGTGLGLSISKSLVELLGGKIWHESELGKGTTFHFTIPNIKTTKPSKQTYGTMEQPVVIDLKGAKILLAEDDHVNMLLLKRTLENANSKVLVAKNGLEVLKIMEDQSDIALVLMDIKMPEMDGIEATRILKLKYPGLPVIAQTAYALPDERKRAIQAGCDDYITKPINIDDLYRIILKWTYSTTQEN